MGEKKKMNTQKKDYQNKIITIPNLMSAFRLCLVPVFVWLYCVKQNYFWTTLTLMLSGLTDIVDGIIARKFHMISNLGKILDPIADKLTQIAMLFCLVSRFPYMVCPLVVLVAKEFFDGVTGLMVIHKTGKVEGAEWHGKVLTVLLYLMMLVHLIWYDIPTAVSNILILACVAMMVISLVLYGKYRIQIIRKKK